MKYSVLLLAFWFSSLSIGSAAPVELSFEQFLSFYQQRNEDLRLAQLQRDLAQQELRVAKDLYQLNFSLQPQWDSRDQDYEVTQSFNTEFQQTELSSSLTQSLPIGSELSLSYSRLLESDDAVSSRTDSQWTLGYSQSLWRNAFGRQTRSQVEAARGRLQSSEKELLQARNDSCLEGSYLFFEAYARQEKLKIYERIYQTSSQVYEITHRSYRQSLVDRIQDLSAEADHLQTRSLYLEAKASLQKSWDSLNLWQRDAETTEKVEYAVLNPQGSVTESSVMGKNESFLRENNFELQSLREELEAVQQDLKVAEDRGRSDLELSLNVGSTEGETLVGSSFEGFEEQFVSVALTWEWPWINESLKSAISQAQINSAVAEENLQRRRRQIEEQWLHEHTEVSNLTQLIAINREKSRLFDQQTVEARKKLRGGRMEVEDYLILRDKSLNEQLSLQDLLERQWRSELRLQSLGQTLPAACL